MEMFYIVVKSSKWSLGLYSNLKMNQVFNKSIIYTETCEVISRQVLAYSMLISPVAGDHIANCHLNRGLCCKGVHICIFGSYSEILFCLFNMSSAEIHEGLALLNLRIVMMLLRQKIKWMVIFFLAVSCLLCLEKLTGRNRLKWEQGSVVMEGAFGALFLNFYVCLIIELKSFNILLCLCGSIRFRDRRRSSPRYYPRSPPRSSRSPPPYIRRHSRFMSELHYKLQHICVE